MRTVPVLALSCLLAISGCAGLRQFPEGSLKYSDDLKTKDADYDAALRAMTAPGVNAGSPRDLRNAEIDRRIRVIDVNFDAFVEALAKENVRANFGLSLVQIGVGAAGALAAETVSQILSAVSGGLAGAQAAYGKTVLYDQTYSALLAQMIAGRKALLVKIYEGRAASIDEYPLPAAAQDLDAYYFAGTLPGAIVATSADAKVKQDRADDALAKFRTNKFSNDQSAQIIRRFVRPPDGKPTDQVNQANLDAFNKWLDASPVKGLPIANFLTNAELRPLREQAIREIPIP